MEVPKTLPPTQDIYAKEGESIYKTDTCMSMFISALLTIAKLWKQPSCPPIDEWIKKIYTYYYLIIIEHDCKWGAV
jgi:hypothetical protein